jgi:hypothetical protein
MTKINNVVVMTLLGILSLGGCAAVENALETSFLVKSYLMIILTVIITRIIATIKDLG